MAVLQYLGGPQGLNRWQNEKVEIEAGSSISCSVVMVISLGSSTKPYGLTTNAHYFPSPVVALLTKIHHGILINIQWKILDINHDHCISNTKKKSK